MSVPYDDSTQKEWKERKGKIEGFYREISKVGAADNEKASSIIVGKIGDNLVVQFVEGDGILYEIVEDVVNPLKMLKTVPINFNVFHLHREISKVGAADNEKASSIIVGKIGDNLVVQFVEGAGILYEIVEDMLSPLKMIKTVSQGKINKFLGKS